MSPDVALLRPALAALSPAGARARLTILTFHRVLAAPDALVPDDPDAPHFRRQMEWVRAFCNVLPLPDAVQRLRAGSLPARACCITFDDGYANNREIALPILRALGLPATIFVAVEAVENGIMWNDLVLEASRTTGGRLDRDALAALGIDAARFTVAAGADGTVAAGLVLDALKYLPTADRWDAALAFHRRVTGRDPPRLMMTPEAVRDVARQGVDVGAHTLRHTILKSGTLAEARREIEGSRDWVAATVGAAPTSFAYPNGRPGVDFEPEHAQLVAAAGFSLAVSTAWCAATRASDPYALPRIAPWDRTRLRYGLRLLATCARSYGRG